MLSQPQAYACVHTHAKTQTRGTLYIIDSTGCLNVCFMQIIQCEYTIFFGNKPKKKENNWDSNYITDEGCPL